MRGIIEFLNGTPGRWGTLGLTVMSLVMTAAGAQYGSAELPHTAACLTVILPMAVLAWLLRNDLPALASFAVVAVIQLTA